MGNFVSDTVDSITGKGAQKAAKDAGKMIAQTAEEGADLTARMYGDYSGRLDPYANVGAGGLAGMQAGAADNSYQNSVAGLMGIANQNYQNVPGFQDASTAMSRQVMSNNAARGKLGSGNTLMDLFKENAMLGEDLKNSAYTRALNTANFNENGLQNRFNRYGSLADMGFNAVNNQATLGSNAVANINNLRTGGTAANAAGLIGAQNARDAGVGNMIALASMASGFMPSSAPATTAAANSTLQPITSTGVRKPMY